ncbi:hypothetical protein [Bacillus glycinifermentans]|uniref:hypothetical protein n=1 Tax=Bacillus glycinifermentans TaxID=1664069 RepID=UPI000BC33422|nr:hypothetical protein [Bacillus glycinifermentans]ATH91562.1 hypothetical protein COP00_02235 [Bacillus glycinifermentans]
MKPIISKELENAIHEKIIIDLCIHAMETKLKKAKPNKDRELIEYYEVKLKKLFSTRKQLNDYLRKENTKVQEVVVCDDMFVEYPYYIRTKEGGIKEGEARYWKAALKLHMKNKLKKL